MNHTHLPKIELHLHLDCNLSYPLVSRLDPSITLEQYRDTFIAPAICSDLADYLTRILPAIQLMQTAENLRLVVDDLFQQLAAENVIYAEIRFGPLLHTEKGLTAHEVVAAVESATTAAIRRTGIEARLILCTLRHYTTAQSMTIIKLVEQFHGTAVTGFDIAADEANFPIDPHIPAFTYAHQKGIPCTAHAGEARGAESIWETLRYIKPARIGHGVRSIEDPHLVDHLRDQQIHLEICPTCNIQTGIFPTFAAHSIDALYQSGLSVGVNTDCRTTSNITLSQEYQKLQQTFAWTNNDLLNCNRSALQAAFIPNHLRQPLLQKLVASYKQQPLYPPQGKYE